MYLKILRPQAPLRLWWPALRGSAQSFYCKCPGSCGIPTGIPVDLLAQQCEAGVLGILLFWLPQLGPNGQGEVLGISV